VPIGFDALHYRLQRAVVRTGVEPRAAVADTVAAAPQVLAPFGVRATDARLVALLYLIDLAARYLQDGQAEAGARLGVLGQWLLPELVAQLADMRCNPLQ
jgi:predicted methyltransferase MtxX (methanogen marker protein 4)